MDLYILKRSHYGGQDIYGVFDKESTAWCMQPKLLKMYPRVPISEYEVVKVELNELTEIESD